MSSALSDNSPVLNAAYQLLTAQLLTAAQTAGTHLYMIIDAAHDERIYPTLQTSTNVRCCLFSEEHITDEIKSVAPYLVKIKHFDDAIKWLIREGLHQHWMLFFASENAHVSELKLHFKRLSMVTTFEGKECFCRYYDPRVLPTFLSASEQHERIKIFKQVRSFWVPKRSSTEGTQILQLTEDGQECLPDTNYFNTVMHQDLNRHTRKQTENITELTKELLI